MRLIDADALKEKFGYTDEWYKSRTVTQIIENAPTVKRPKGKWILKETDYDDGGNNLYECDNCHHSDVQSGSIEVPYCWHCGADMRDK